MTAHRAGAVVYVQDIGRVRRFYEDVCMLAMVEADDETARLVSDEWELHLVRVPDDVAATIQMTVPPRRRRATPVKLVFAVADLEVARTRAVAAGGIVDDPAHEWPYDGAVVCDGHDPEGNVVQLRAATG